MGDVSGAGCGFAGFRDHPSGFSIASAGIDIGPGRSSRLIHRPCFQPPFEGGTQELSRGPVVLVSNNVNTPGRVRGRPRPAHRLPPAESPTRSQPGGGHPVAPAVRTWGRRRIHRSRPARPAPPARRSTACGGPEKGCPRGHRPAVRASTAPAGRRPVERPSWDRCCSPAYTCSGKSENGGPAPAVIRFPICPGVLADRFRERGGQRHRILPAPDRGMARSAGIGSLLWACPTARSSVCTSPAGPGVHARPRPGGIR